MENFIDKYSQECRKPIGQASRLFPSFELLPINVERPDWSVKGKIGNFQWRSLGALFPNSELTEVIKARYKSHYEQCARGGCIHASFLIMHAISHDPVFNSIISGENSLNVIVANTQALQPNSNDFPVLNEFVLTLQQNMSLIDEDVFRVKSANGTNVSLSIDPDVIEGKIVILPFCYTNTPVLRGYAQLAASLMQGGAKCVLAVSFVHAMPNKYGQEEFGGNINLPMPRGRGYSFSELADMF